MREDAMGARVQTASIATTTLSPRTIRRLHRLYLRGWIEEQDWPDEWLVWWLMTSEPPFAVR
jgi:hypothetical protein